MPGSGPGAVRRLPGRDGGGRRRPAAVVRRPRGTAEPGGDGAAGLRALHGGGDGVRPAGGPAGGSGPGQRPDRPDPGGDGGGGLAGGGPDGPGGAVGGICPAVRGGPDHCGLLHHHDPVPAARGGPGGAVLRNGGRLAGAPAGERDFLRRGGGAGGRARLPLLPPDGERRAGL